jgi:2-hydroxychromene-2-carboxylate isomerase
VTLQKQDIRFYFDFASPYGYLGSVEVERVAERLGLSVDWHPTLLGVSVLKVMGLKAVADTPLKRDYARHDVERFARYLEIPFRRSEVPMQPLAAARAFCWLNERDRPLAKRFAQAVYHTQWARGQNVSAPETIAEVGAANGIDPVELDPAINSEAVKALLRSRVDAAIAAGVFGVPTFVVENELFWGVDRLPMLEAWLRRGGW